MIRDRGEANALYNKVKLPIAISTIFLAVYCANGTGWKWFSYHPLTMIIGCLTIPPLAALIKKIGGYENTKLHGNLFLLSLFLIGIGSYVIYSNKEMMGKEHIQTFHAKVGLVAILGYIGSLLGAFTALHPDYGKFTTNQNFRKAHRLASRLWILVSWYAVYTGFVKIESSEVYHYFLIAGLLLLTPLVI